jgi:integrase/recombinase XerD
VKRDKMCLDEWLMTRRRALTAGVKTEIGCQKFQATGITTYLEKGGKLKGAQEIGNHESTRTTGLLRPAQR